MQGKRITRLQFQRGWEGVSEEADLEQRPEAARDLVTRLSGQVPASKEHKCQDPRVAGSSVGPRNSTGPSVAGAG